MIKRRIVNQIVAGDITRLILFAAVLIFSLQAEVQQKAFGTADKISRILNGAVSPRRMEKLARPRDFDLPMTAETQSNLQSAVTLDSLLWRLQKLTPKTSIEMPQRAKSTAAFGKVKENSKDGLKYVWIPGGSFHMGCSSGDNECSDDEKPLHEVTISKGYWLGETLVTVGAYKRFARSVGKTMPPEPNILGRALNSGWNNEAMPIVNVVWDDSRDYCTWAGGRMPTEAEWEYAARGGSTDAQYGPLDEVAWYADNSGQHPLNSAELWKDGKSIYEQKLKSNGNGMHEVARKRANKYGLYDMLGNVEEWVSDRYGASYYQSSPSQDPTGPASGTFGILRGGSWYSRPWVVRVSHRIRPDPGIGYNHVGFRCVGELQNP